MRNQSSLVRGGLLCGLSLGAWLAGTSHAVAEVTLIERDGFSFFTDGRVNAFFSQGYGDDFPQPTPNAPGAPEHSVLGKGQPSTAGYVSSAGNVGGTYNAQRVRNGFLATILSFGLRQQLSETTRLTSYISLWGSAQSYARDRTQDYGSSTSKGFDVREGYVGFEGPWGSVIAGRQLGLLGGISTEIDYLYGHNYGLGLPCADDYYATCGQIGSGALGPGYAAGFVYTTPTRGGFKLRAGIFDPVRLLGVWERLRYPRPEGTISYERSLGPTSMFKLQVEGMYQDMAQQGSVRDDRVWGVAGGGRLEVGPFRFGASAFRGKGLGAYVAIQNSASSFNSLTRELRYFTGLYAQAAVVIGRSQISSGIGRVTDDLLESDKVDPGTSNLKSQTGISAAYYFSVSQHLALGMDGFRFQTDWWGAPNSMFDATGAPVVLPGFLKGEKQVIYFLNVGATYHW